MTKLFVPRIELVDALITRDGLVCQHPDCGRALDPKEPEGPLQVTIDHTEPQVWCRENGWTDDQIWSLDNLTLMHKKCNADKGSRRFIDGELEPKPTSRLRYRRDRTAQRPEVCTSCNAGRDLGPDELCAACGSGPLPHRWPRWAKVSSKECLHDGVFWCWLCSSGLVEMPSATDMIVHGGEGGTDVAAAFREEAEKANVHDNV